MIQKLALLSAGSQLGRCNFDFEFNVSGVFISLHVDVLTKKGKTEQREMDDVHREVTQSFMLDFTGQSAAPCLQVERLTGSLADALFDMANDHHCLPSPLEAFVKHPKNSDPFFFEVRHS